MLVPRRWPGWPRSPPGGPAETDHRTAALNTLARAADLARALRAARPRVRVQRRPGVAGAHPARLPGEVRRGGGPGPARPRSRPGRRGPVVAVQGGVPDRSRPRRRPGPGSSRSAPCRPGRGAQRDGRRVLAARPAPPARRPGPTATSRWSPSLRGEGMLATLSLVRTMAPVTADDDWPDRARAAAEAEGVDPLVRNAAAHRRRQPGPDAPGEGLGR